MRNLKHAEALHTKIVAIAEKILKTSIPDLDYEVAVNISASGGELDIVATAYEIGESDPEEDELEGPSSHEFVMALYSCNRITAAEEIRKLRALERATR